MRVCFGQPPLQKRMVASHQLETAAAEPVNPAVSYMGEIDHFLCKKKAAERRAHPEHPLVSLAQPEDAAISLFDRFA